MVAHAVLRSRAVTNKSILNTSTIGAVLLLSVIACTEGSDETDGDVSRIQRASSVRAVDLGAAANFAILTKTGVTSVPPTEISGNVGVSPIAATAITGFALRADATNVFATSAQVNGSIYAASYASPTPSNMTTAIGDMETAFTDAAGRPASVTELGAGNIGGKTLTPGVYKWSTGVLIPTSATLSGSGTDVWIFEIAQNLTFSSGAAITLAGGARAENIFWEVSGGVVLNSTAHLEGVVLAKTAITLAAGASVHGRLLGQTAVTLINNTVIEP